MVLKLIAVGILSAILLIDVGYAASNFPFDGKYPEPPRENVQDTYPGPTTITDPYQYLEKPQDPRTIQFIKDEIDVTKNYLARGLDRADIKARYEELWNIEKYDGPFQKGNKYFSYRNGVLYVQDSLNDDGKIFLDPKDISGKLDEAVSAFSPNGLIFAYLTTGSDSDSSTIQFKNLEQGVTYTEKLTEVNTSSITWTNDNKGIFYSSFGSPGNKVHKLYYHKLGSDPKTDIPVAQFPEISNYLISSDISNDGKYLVVSVSIKGTNTNQVHLVNLETISYTITGELDLIPLVEKADYSYKFVTNAGSKFIFQTNDDADKSKLVFTDLSDRDSWDDLVSEEDEKVLDWAAPAGNEYLVLSYIQKVSTVLQLHKISNGERVKTFNLGTGTVKAETFYSNKDSKEIFFKFVSFFTPGIIYRFDLSNTSSDPTVHKKIDVPNFKASDYTLKQVEARSKDGTMIPMYITYKNDLQQNKNNFAFMTANGGFGISNLPYFSVNRIAVIDNMHGVHAVPNIRGGGEFGEDWHENGSQQNKQNSMDDFIAAAEFLINEKYTSAELLAVDGGAAGTSGPLMGAVLNQQPKLFGAVIAEAGVMDMLRFDKTSIGEDWVPEYGSPSDEDDFDALQEYSPLHHVKITTTPYPATMLLTAANDDRVPALHSLKFIATLQHEAKEKSIQTNPLIIKIQGSGDIALDDAVDITLFIVMNTGAKFRKP